MKRRMVSLLFELMKDSKRSDRQLAKVLGVSQPTVTRMRSRLVKEEVIREFTVIPDLVKMGYEILAINCFKSKMKKELEEKAVKWTMSKPNIIFAARCEGMGKNGMIISVHKSYSDYSNFFVDLMYFGGDDLQDYDTLLISLGGLIVKPFSLKYLAEPKEMIKIHRSN